MPEYIEREAVLKHRRKMSGADFGGEFWDEAVLAETIRSIHAADVVSKAVLEQVMWERDMAMEQLQEHGIPFGGKADVVAVVRCKDCDISTESHLMGDGWRFCKNNSQHHKDEHFCGYGKRRDEDE